MYLDSGGLAEAASHSPWDDTTREMAPRSPVAGFFAYDVTVQTSSAVPGFPRSSEVTGRPVSGSYVVDPTCTRSGRPPSRAIRDAAAAGLTRLARRMMPLSIVC